jgi:hypothetical protein
MWSYWTVELLRITSRYAAEFHFQAAGFVILSLRLRCSLQSLIREAQVQVGLRQTVVILQCLLITRDSLRQAPGATVADPEIVEDGRIIQTCFNCFLQLAGCLHVVLPFG